MWQVRAGSTLIAWLVGKEHMVSSVDTAYPTPKDVRLMIECGIGKGWAFGERGANVSLTSRDRSRVGSVRGVGYRSAGDARGLGNKVKIPNSLQYVVCCSSLILILTFSLVSIQESSCETTSVQPQQVVQSDVVLKPLWAENIRISSETTSSLVVTPDLVVTAQTCGEVDAFDLSTGEVRWQVPHLNNPKNLVLDINHQSIYLSEISSLRAISVSSGETLWVNNSPLFSHTANPSYLLTTGELVVDAVGNGFYYVDPVTGNMGDKINVPVGSIFYTRQVTFVKTPDMIQAFDNGTQQILWSSSNLLGSWEVILFENAQTVLIRQRYDNIAPTLIALDWNTGEVKWQTEDKKIVSNIIVSGEKLFALDDRDELLILDINTGKRVNLTSFAFQSGNNARTFADDVRGGQIALQGSIIAIYFGVSHILSLYQLGSS